MHAGAQWALLKWLVVWEVIIETEKVSACVLLGLEDSAGLADGGLVGNSR